MNNTLIKSIKNTELTEYIVQKLQYHNITTVLQLLEEDVEKLCEITGLNKHAIIIIRKFLIRKHCLKPFVNAFDLYKKQNKTIFTIIPTGIKSLDKILNGGFKYNDLIEINGNPSSGKTLFCLTLALNFAKNQCMSIRYIDTKHDFSSLRLNDILKCYGLLDESAFKIMRRIRVEKPTNVKDFIKVLNKLFHDQHFTFIIIDSLPSIWLSLEGDEKSDEGKALLTEATCLLRKLIQVQNKIVIVVNIPNSWTKIDTEENVILEDDDSDKSQTIKPSLGKYWETIPTLRLLIEEKDTENSYLFPNDNKNDLINYHNTFNSDQRLIKIVKSCDNETGKYCIVTINKKGII